MKCWILLWTITYRDSNRINRRCQRMAFVLFFHIWTRFVCHQTVVVVSSFCCGNELIEMAKKSNWIAQCQVYNSMMVHIALFQASSNNYDHLFIYFILFDEKFKFTLTWTMNFNSVSLFIEHVLFFLLVCLVPWNSHAILINNWNVSTHCIMIAEC